MTAKSGVSPWKRKRSRSHPLPSGGPPEKLNRTGGSTGLWRRTQAKFKKERAWKLGIYKRLFILQEISVLLCILIEVLKKCIEQLYFFLENMGLINETSSYFRIRKIIRTENDYSQTIEQQKCLIKNYEKFFVRWKNNNSKYL